MALRRIKAEKKKNLWETFGPSVPSFADFAKASRKALFEFAEDSDISEEHASAMRVYMNTKLGVSSTVSYEHVFFCFPVNAFLPLPTLRNMPASQTEI